MTRIIIRKPGHWPLDICLPTRFSFLQRFFFFTSNSEIELSISDQLSFDEEWLSKFLLALGLVFAFLLDRTLSIYYCWKKNGFIASRIFFLKTEKWLGIIRHCNNGPWAIFNSHYMRGINKKQRILKWNSFSCKSSPSSL